MVARPHKWDIDLVQEGQSKKTKWLDQQGVVIIGLSAALV